MKKGLIVIALSAVLAGCAHNIDDANQETGTAAAVLVGYGICVTAGVC